MAAGRYTKEAAIINIRDYYAPPYKCMDSQAKQLAAFELAKSEYLSALKNQIEVSEKITFSDVFPKSKWT